MSFGNRVLILRKEKKISQTDLAKKLAIHPNVLGRYEREEVNPSIEMAIKIADALGISVDYLVGKIDLVLDKSMIEQLQVIQKLPDEDRHCIMYTIDGLVKNAKTKLAYSSK